MIQQQAGPEVSGMDVLHSETASIFYIQQGFNNALGGGQVYPKDNMKFVVALVILKNREHPNITIDLDKIFAFDDSGAKHPSKAYTVYKDAYFPFRYYTNFTATSKLESETFPIKQLGFDKNIFNIQKINKNSDISFRVAFELPRDAAVSSIEWYGKRLQAEHK